MSDTWWDLAADAGVLAQAVVGLVPGQAELAIEPWIRPSTRDPVSQIRRKLHSTRGVIERMVAVSRQPSVAVPALPDDFSGPEAHRVICHHACVRILRADAGRAWEERQHGECVSRIEAIAGLALHSMQQQESIWILLGGHALGMACTATKVFAASIEQSRSGAELLDARLAEIEVQLPRVREVLKSDVPDTPGVPGVGQTVDQWALHLSWARR